ncbi:MAG: hypothetical protein IMZ66_11240 [Planctomycetes bacterium]|nr:hypothetical protein [Planctomycetota bacterium]
MRVCMDGQTYDTADLLPLHLGPIPSWLGGDIDLVEAYADRDGRLIVHQESRHVDEATGRPVGDVWTRAGRKLVAYLTERFELPTAYLAAAPRED